MSKHLKWTDRTFQFTFPVEVYPEMIERLRGTPARLEDRVRSIAAEILTRRDGERWSIQENAGHLLDLESLFSRRLDEYLAGAKTLQAADMSNRKTDEANRAFTHATEINPKLTAAYVNLGVTYFRTARTTIESGSVPPSSRRAIGSPAGANFFANFARSFPRTR